MKPMIFFTALFSWLFLFSADCHAKITGVKDMQVRILYDNSGSMYPGYRLEGQKKSRLGARFFYEYPEFRECLAEMISSQRQFDAKHVSITVFTEHELTEILPPTRPDQIDQAAIAGAFEKLKDPSGRFRWGQYTYLTENLEKFIRGFEGVVWLITDNIIDTREGTPDNQDILNFFRILNEKPEYHAVHLFKYPFADSSKDLNSNLAIYGMLVSPGPVATETAAFFDPKFVRLKSLFPGNEHLKLKDLSVNPIELETPIDVEILEKKVGLFSENQKVRFSLKGLIRSNLTQHTITSGDYRIAVEGPFIPDQKAVKEFGVKPIRSSEFKEIRDQIKKTISPRGVRQIEKSISSSIPVSLSIQRGIVPFIRSAFGMKAVYKGKARFSLYNVKVKLERGYLAGIYGIDQASSVFDFQDVKEIDVKSRTVPLEFTLTTGSAKGIFLLFILLAILALFGVLLWLLFQRERCRIRADQASNIVAFSRFGSHHLVHSGRLIGIIRRGFGKVYTFHPSRMTAGLEVTPRTDEGFYDVKLKAENFLVSIEPLNGGTVKHTIKKETDRSSVPRSGTRPRPPGLREGKGSGRKIEKPRL
jgi:hypothetical protein